MQRLFPPIESAMRKEYVIKRYDLTQLTQLISNYVENLCVRVTEYEGHRHGGYLSSGSEAKGLREGLYIGKQAIRRVHCYPLNSFPIADVEAEMLTYIRLLSHHMKGEKGIRNALRLRKYITTSNQRVKRFYQQNGCSEYLPYLIDSRRLFAELEFKVIKDLYSSKNSSCEALLNLLRPTPDEFGKYCELPLVPNLRGLLTQMRERVNLACDSLNQLPRDEGVHELAGLHGVNRFLHDEMNSPQLETVSAQIMKGCMINEVRT